MPTLPLTALTTTNTFRDWLTRTNNIIDILNSSVLASTEVGGAPIGTFTIGSGVDTTSSLTIAGGKFFANATGITLQGTSIFGANLTVNSTASNTVIGSGQTHLVSSRTVVNGVNLYSNATSTFNGAVVLTTTTPLTVGGIGTFSNLVNFTGNSIVVSGNTSIGGNTIITGNTTIGGNLTVSGTITGAATFSGALVDGDFTVTGKITVQGTGSSLAGTVNALGTFGITGAGNALSTFGITGAGNALSTFGITGAANALSTFGISGAGNALSTFGITGAANALSTLGVTANATFSANVYANTAAGDKYLYTDKIVAYNNFALAGSGSVMFLANNTTLQPATVEERVIPLGTLSSTQTLSLANGTVITATLSTGATAFTLPSPAAGRSFLVYLKQNSTPTGTATWASPSGSLKWPNNGSAPTITTTANRVDLFSFASDGTNWYASYVQNY